MFKFNHIIGGCTLIAVQILPEESNTIRAYSFLSKGIHIMRRHDETSSLYHMRHRLSWHLHPIEKTLGAVIL